MKTRSVPAGFKEVKEAYAGMLMNSDVLNVRGISVKYCSERLDFITSDGSNCKELIRSTKPHDIEVHVSVMLEMYLCGKSAKEIARAVKGNVKKVTSDIHVERSKLNLPNNTETRFKELLASRSLIEELLLSGFTITNILEKWDMHSLKARNTIIAWRDALVKRRKNPITLTELRSSYKWKSLKEDKELLVLSNGIPVATVRPVLNNSEKVEQFEEVAASVGYCFDRDSFTGEYKDAYLQAAWIIQSKLS